MAQYNKQYFLNKFVPNYIVTAQDMQDLTDSTLFYQDDIGFDVFGTCYIDNSSFNTVLTLTNKRIVKVPYLKSQLLTLLDISFNVELSSYNLPPLQSLTNFCCNNCLLSHISIDDSNNNIHSIIANNNFLTFLDTNMNCSQLLTAVFSVNSFDVSGIERLLLLIASGGSSCSVDLTGGSNAAHSTWSPTALSAESLIINNGGSVASNP